MLFTKLNFVSGDLALNLRQITQAMATVGPSLLTQLVRTIDGVGNFLSTDNHGYMTRLSVPNGSD